MSIEKFLSNVVVDGTISKVGGTSTQFLKADGSVDTNVVPYTGAIQNVDLGEYQLKAGQIEFDQTPTGTAGVAKLRWNDSEGTLDLGLKGGNVTLQLGQEQIIRIVNKTGVNLLESAYQVIYISGAQGNRLKVDLALANSDLTSTGTIGLVTETINNNQEGFITSNGLVRGINTTGSLQGETWADGDVLYVSASVAGKLTNVKPIAPQHTVIVGILVSAHATQGSIFVKVDNGYELEELHNVLINTPLNNDTLVYETSTGLWKNKTISTALGYTPENVANKSDSYTASSSTTYASTKALVDGLSTKAPISGSANYIQNQNASAQSANMWISGLIRSDAGFNGALDLNYNNSSTSGLNYWAGGTSTKFSVTNTGAATFASTVAASNGTLIGGTLTSGYIPKATGANSLGNSLIYDNGTNVGIGTTSPSAKLHIEANANGSGLGLRINTNTRAIGEDYIWFGDNSIPDFLINTTGNVGIGTTSPGEKLTVSDGKLFLTTSDPTIGGKIYGYNDTSVNLYSGGLKFQTRYFDGSNYVYADKLTINSSGNVLIGTTTDNDSKLRVEGDTYISGKVSLGQSTYHKPATTQCAGEIVYYGTGTTVAGKLYYLSTGLVWTLADSDAAASSSGMLGIAIGTNPATNGMLVRGSARFDALTPYTAMTAGQILYVSTTAGDFTATAPTGTGKVVRVIGYCVDDTNNTLYFCPDNTWIELT